MKPFTDAQYAFKAAVRRCVQMAGGCNAAAQVTRVDAARLSRYGNLDSPEFAPIDVCLELDVAAGAPICLRALADVSGFELTPRNVDAATAIDLAHAAGQVAKESGDLVSAAIEAGADGKLSPNEARRLHDEAADLGDKVVRLQNIVRPAMGGRSS